MQDPRQRNRLMDTSSIGRYLSSYVEQLSEVAAQVSETTLDEVVALLGRTSREGRVIFVAGNGGSAAIADHLCCDWTKGTHVHGQPPIRTQSLSANSALFTALANDFGYEHVFSRQLEMLGSKGDVLIAVSSSGNSPNILRGVEQAKQMGITTVGFSGFEGGKLAKACDISLHIPVSNYGVVEDAHQLLMHVLAQFIAAGRDGKKGN